GKPYEEKAPDGTDSYMSIKGSFLWGKNLKPEYVWFNGNAKHYILGDKIDPSGLVQINTLLGSYDDEDSKIVPVKVHRANQIYDTEHLTLIQPKTFSSKPGDGGYWKEFDWNKAAAEGMKAVNLPYSGKYGFVRTEMTWPINHMVGTKDKTVACGECHTRDNGRMAKLQGFYMPGRDRNEPIEGLGRLLLLATLLGAFAHGGSRLVAGWRNRRDA
ncbi:MAG TPA: cytochrome C, partial [Fimbriimonas sp.]